METVKKIIIGCIVAVLLILIFILILSLRVFINKGLEEYNIKKDLGVSRDVFSAVQKETGLAGEGEVILPRYQFSVGEKLNYFIYSAGIRVGNASITYLGKQDLGGAAQDVILVQVKAPGFSDRDIIYGDIETFSPTKVERQIKLFNEDIEIIEEYRKDKKEVFITREGKKTTTQKIISDNKIGNIILLLYHFRSNKDKHKIGERISFNLPTQKLEMFVDKDTAIKVPAGEFQAIFVKSDPARFKVWFRGSDRIPLRIQGAIGFGNTYLDLKEVE